ncbi:MAG TPA: hypothetical protein VG734_20270, partial [Lacunisphaera sp.]|nr:hypothetical protein [Lacunisphaera sp.]
PGNLQRTPRTWVKPNVSKVVADVPIGDRNAHSRQNPGSETTEQFAPYRRDDDFSGPQLNPVWQWNHVPDDAKWSLSARAGYLRLSTLPAKDFWTARNTLTQRAVGPEGIPTAELELAGLQPGDVAGLALLNLPHAWIGVARTADGLTLTQFDQRSGASATAALPAGTTRVWLRAACDFIKEEAAFSYSADGEKFTPFGRQFTMVFQLKTFQGIRYSLFAYNADGRAGGYADFDSFTVAEPQANGGNNRIPLGKVITLTSVADDTRLVAWNGLLRPMAPGAAQVATPAARFRVVDRGLGRVALQTLDGSGTVAVSGIGGMGDVRLLKSPGDTAASFQWQDLLGHEVMFLSLVTHRHIHAEPNSGELTSADSPGARPGKKDGAVFRWEVVPE